MTVPNFLSSSFYYSIGSSPITDVATVITDVRTILTSTNNPPWIEQGVSTGIFRSPLDSANRFMQISLTKVTATRLTVQLQDQNLITIYTREFDIQATAEVLYYTGQYHFILESYNGTATSDRACAFMLDVSPYALNSSQNYVLGSTYRASGGGIDANGSSFGQFFMLENGTTAQRDRSRAVGQTAAAGSLGLLDFQGNPQIFPVDIHCITNGSINSWGGKLYQAYMMPYQAGAGSIKRIALDDGTLASFRVLQTTAINNCSMAIRVA